MTVSQKNKRKRNNKFSRNIRGGVHGFLGVQISKKDAVEVKLELDGIYEFDDNKTLYVCSDLEGGNNFKDSGTLIDHDFNDVAVEDIDKKHIDNEENHKKKKKKFLMN